MTILWPINILPPRDLSVDIAPRSLAGPSSVSGFGQVVASDAGLWKIVYGSVPVLTEQRVKAWRAIDNLLEGRLNPILVPIERRYQPYAAADEGLYEAVPHDDETYFDDGSGYLGMVIDVVAASNAAVRAVSMTVTVTYADDIQPGQHFSVGERLYRIRSFDEDTGVMTFRPPLREAVSIGDRLEFDFPVCRMKLQTDSEMNLGLGYNRWGTPSVAFIEDL